MAEQHINVSFLKGTQSGFDNLTSYIPGAFYLTTDTNRLYFADANNKAKYLNKYVYTVASETDLTAAITNKDVTDGDFVYVNGKNALVAIKSGTGKGWVQINAYQNNNDNTKVSGLTFTKNVDGANDSITINYTLSQSTHHQDGSTNNETDLTGSFVISGSDIADIIPASEVNVGATVATNKATVKTSGTGSAGTGFTIAGSGSVTVGGSTNAITIKGENTTYNLTSPAGEAVVKLEGSNGTDPAVTLIGGTQINVTGATAGKIDIAHATINTTDNVDEPTAESPTSGGSFTTIDSLTLDNGHVTGYNTKKVTLPKAPVYDITGITGDSAGKLTITLKETNSGKTDTTVSNADFYYTVNGTRVYNQGSIDFYTKAQIDSKLSGINAMVYKGTVGIAPVTTLPTTNVAVGDTYMVAAKGTYSGHLCDVGDLLIAVGTETNGVITSDLTWTYVPSGDDTDTQFALEVADASTETEKKANIKLKNSTNDSDAGIATIKAGNDVEVSTSGTVITVAHQGFSTESGTANSSITNNKFTALTGVTTDNGHLTGYTSTTFTIPTDKDTTYALSTSTVPNTNNQAKIIITGGGTGTGSGKDSSIILAAGTDLTATTSSGLITLNHKTYNANPTLTSEEVTVNSGGTFTALTAIKTSNGHITGYTEKTYTIPQTPVYKLSGSTVTGITNGVQIVNTLTGEGGASGQKTTSTLNITSSSLKIVAGTKACTVNIEWGSF